MSYYLLIVHNLFASDPAVLAEWESASHVKNAPKKAKAPTPPPATP